MKRLLPLALPLALAFAAGFASPQEKRPPEIPKAAEESYSKLVEDWSAAFTPYMQAIADARAKKAPDPEGPHKRFAARFAELARAGHPGAASWCLQYVDKALDAESERRELFLAAEATLLPHALASEDPSRPAAFWPTTYGIKEILRAIGTSTELLGKEKALSLCDELFQKAGQPASKAHALYAQATIRLAGVARDAETPPEVLEIYRRLAADYAETDTGKRAAGQLFRMENLTIGKVAPDFATEDVEGVAFKLSDYRGKVVVLDFWGFW